MWTCIFCVCPHSISETHFYFMKNYSFGKIRVATYFILFLKEKIKQEKNPKKETPLFFWKNVSLKTRV